MAYPSSENSFSNSLHFAVMLQPFEYDAAENKRHKFMVQTMIVSNDTQDIEHMVSKVAFPQAYSE